MTNTNTVWTKIKGIHVAGTSYHQGALFHTLKLLKADKNESVKAFLVLDKNNKYDENAIKVILKFKNNAKSYYPIGFIPKEMAKWMAPNMKSGLRAVPSSVKIVGTAKGQTIGVILNINYQVRVQTAIPAMEMATEE